MQKISGERGFPDSSVGKESACNARDPSLIPGSGRSAGDGIGYPLQYSWASLVAQLVNNLPAVRETWVRSLGWEDPLGEGKGHPLQHSGLENSMDCRVNGVTKSRLSLGGERYRTPKESESPHSGEQGLYLFITASLQPHTKLGMRRLLEINICRSKEPVW